MKQYKLKEIKKGEDFNPSDICSNVPFTQAGFYGVWQNGLGLEAKRFLIYCNEKVVAYFQIVKYPLLFGKSYLYIPYGPVSNDLSKDFFIFLKKEIVKITKKENAIFTRLDFTPRVSPDVLSGFFTKASSFSYRSVFFQPRHEWFLKLDKTEEDLLAEMHSKTRYSVRLSERKKITSEIVVKDFMKYFDDFYGLILDTANRNGFSLHKKSYYESIFQNLSQVKNAYLSIARYNQKILAVDLVIVFSGIANYVFGGSSSEERNRMPTYLAQWGAILKAKELGCGWYNFGGISNGDEKDKSYGGITVFKKKFGGEEVFHSDFFDVVVNPAWYFVYNIRKYIKNKL